MKEDIIELLTNLVMAVFGLAMGVVMFALLGLVGKLVWSAFQLGWNLVF